MHAPETYIAQVRKDIQGPGLPKIWCAGMQGVADAKQGERQIDLLAQVRARTLVIHGMEDMISGWDTNAKRTADGINQGGNGNAELVVLDECGHFPWVEKKEQYVDKVGQFLEAST
jgi:pimeloyl-ACP methyl ester carboxylesterase